MNQIKLNKFRLNKRQKIHNLFNLMKKIRVKKYIKNQFKQIHTCKDVGRKIEEEKVIQQVFIMNYLIYIYTLYIEEVDMNKKSQNIIGEKDKTNIYISKNFSTI